MNISSLPEPLVAELRSISGPARYLFPGPAHADTGSISRSALLIGPGRDGHAFLRPGFHRLYRRLQQLPKWFTEHFIHPAPDYFRCIQKHRQAPWSLESRRSIFSFPVWVCYLSWPGDWFALQDLIDTLETRTDYKHGEKLVCIVPSRSFPLRDHISEQADLLLSEAELPVDRKRFLNLLQLVEDEEKISENKLSSDVGSKRPSLVASKERIRPVPFVRTNVKNRCWIGQIDQYDQNHDLQSPGWPSLTHHSPSTTLDLVTDVVNQQGIQFVTLGQVLTKNKTDPARWDLEFLERFHTHWGQRPICYQLGNPRPDHPVWKYDHLLDRYNNTSLSAHLGTANDSVLHQANQDQLHRWMNYFLSAGGPKMKFFIDVSNTSEDVSGTVDLCEQLQFLNQNSIGGKGQLRVFLQPELRSGKQWPSKKQHRKFCQRVRERQPDGPLKIQLNLPDFYERMRAV